MKSWRLGVVFFVLLALPYVSFGQIYEWMDENGVKHFSNEPPPEGIEEFSQTDEIITEEKQLQRQEGNEQPDRNEPAGKTAEKDAPAEQAANPDAEAASPDPTVVSEDEDREAFHRERIKRRTRQNTSDVPSVQDRRRSKSP